MLLQEAGVPQGKVQILGSADWNNDSTIANTPYLVGALYPATDDAGFKTLSADYQAMFGRPPHAFATLAYTAVILANATSLALGTPNYPAAAAHDPQRLQRPRRRLPLPCRRPQRVCSGDQGSDRRRLAGRRHRKTLGFRGPDD